MTSEDILKQMASLPDEARREIEDHIALLHAKYASRKPSARNFESERFFGIWRDRDEMTDSTAWVRHIREKHWAN